MIDVFLFLAAIAAQSDSRSETGAAGEMSSASAGEAAGGSAVEQTADAPPAFLSPTPQLTAEPQVPTGKFTTAVEVKPILGATRGNWVAVREFNGQDLLYVTHLWSWRCGLAQVRLGINGAPPEVWPLPSCHADQPSPNMILEQDGLPYRSFGLGTVNVIDVELTYDDLTTETAQFERSAVKMP